MIGTKGSACMKIELSGGKITVTHGSCGTVLHEGDAKEGAWAALWVTLRKQVVCEHLDFADDLTGARCLDCNAKVEATLRGDAE